MLFCAIGAQQNLPSSQLGWPSVMKHRGESCAWAVLGSLPAASKKTVVATCVPSLIARRGAIDRSLRARGVDDPLALEVSLYR
jgi:hypothetical protein